MTKLTQFELRPENMGELLLLITVLLMLAILLVITPLINIIRSWSFMSRVFYVLFLKKIEF